MPCDQSFGSTRCLLLLTLIFNTTLAGYPSAHSTNPSSGRRVARDKASRRGSKEGEDSKFFSFITRPDIQAPKWEIKKVNKHAISSGYWFVAPYAELNQVDYPLWNGPHIYDGDGELIWSGTALFENRNTFDFRVVTFNGKPGLSLIDPAQEHEGGVILDNGYNIQHTVDLLGDLKDTNMHDFTVVDNGKYALTLTKVPGGSTKEESLEVGFDGKCKAGWEGFKELDVMTSSTIFEWDPHGYIGLDESTKITNDYEKMCKNGWDLLHLNSIDKFEDGDYLLSARHTDTIYKISHLDGEIVWRLGGINSDFKFDKLAVFSRQHHARVRSQNSSHTIISLFDNARGDGAGEHKTHRFSRGLLLSLRTDTRPMTAGMLAHYDHPDKVITPSRGSMEYLENGNALVCYTYGSLFAEYSADGKIIMKAHSKYGRANTYRAYKFPWSGHPSRSPDVHSAVRLLADGSMQMIVHVSWNGATEVARWDVYDTDGQNKKGTLMASTLRQGFESVLEHSGYAQYVIAEAYDSHGKLLAASEATPTDPEPGMEVAMHEQATDNSIMRTQWIAFLFGVVITIFVALLLRLSWTWTRRSKIIETKEGPKYELLANDQEDGDEYEMRSPR